MIAATSRRSLIFSPTSRCTCTCALRQRSARQIATYDRFHLASRTSKLARVRPPALEFSTSSSFKEKHLKPYLLADVGEGITECEIIKWFVQEGATIQEFDPLVEVQSDKASVEITSRYAGVVKTLHHGAGDVAKVGSALCDIEIDVEAEDGPVASAEGPSAQEEPSSSNATPISPPAPQEHKSFKSTSSPSSPVLATPAVRRVSREHGINLSDVRGSGRDGRVLKEDVVALIDGGKETSTTGSSSALPSNHTPSASDSLETVALSPMRRAMFKAMTTSQTIPHFCYSDELDVTALEVVRATLSSSLPVQYRTELSHRDLAALERAGLARVEEEARISKLTMLPLLLKALDLAMRQHALFRSRLVLPADGAPNAATLQQHSSSLVSVALSSPKGLLTPTLPPLNTLSVPSIASYIQSLQIRARAPKGLGQSDLLPPAAGKPGTLTLSNIGAVAGGSYTFPLLPPTGQLAIGALGRARKTPRYLSETPEWRDSAANLGDADELVPRLLLPVSFTADHRVVEGAELASFVQTWKELVERPQSWLSMLV